MSAIVKSGEISRRNMLKNSVPAENNDIKTNSTENDDGGTISTESDEVCNENVKHVGDTVYKTGVKRKCSTSPFSVRKKVEGGSSVKNGQSYREKLSHVEEILSDESIQFVLQNKSAHQKIPGVPFRNRLTQNNIRTILRHVLSNKYIFTMLQRIMKGDYNNPSELKIETGFEPRLTRLKAREMKTKQCEELSWPFASPAKKRFLDEEYPEESSDEEYRPNKDEIQSDEDETLSVKTSEFDSPPKSMLSSPIFKAPNPVSEDEDALIIAIPENEEGVRDDSEEGDVAQRTRSKQPLNGTPFIPPDLTVEMFDTGCDNDWDNNPYKHFICGLNQPIEPTVLAVNDEKDQDDVEDDDPEYFPSEEEVDEDDICWDFLEGPEFSKTIENADDQKDVDDPDFVPFEKVDEDYLCLNDSLEVAKDELNGLMAEILQFAQQDLEGVQDEEIKATNVEPSVNIVEVVQVQDANTKVYWMNREERQQVDEQMRMHVQLLTQSYLLSHSNPKLNFINQSSKIFLEELKMFADREIAIDEKSAFYSHNLDGSLAIVEDFENLVISLPETRRANMRPHMAPGVPQHVRETLASNTVFIYPELLPKVGLCDNFRKGKVVFHPAEDNLIALGMEQFAGMRKSVEHIQKLLVPAKTVLQIRCHIKGSRRDRAAENNPIKYYSMHKRAPQFVRVIRVFDPNNIKPPEDFPPSALPQWMAPYSKVEIPPSPKPQLQATVVPKLQERKKPVPILPKNLVFVVPIPENLGVNPSEPQFDSSQLTLIPQGATLIPQGATLIPQGATLIPQGATLIPQGATLIPQGTPNTSESTSELDSDSESRSTTDIPNEDSERSLVQSERLYGPVVIKDEIVSSDDETVSISDTWSLSTSSRLGEMSSLSFNEDTEDYMSNIEKASNCSESNAEPLHVSIKVEEDSVSGLQPTLVMALSKKDASETNDGSEKSLSSNEYLMSNSVPCGVIEDAVYFPVTENLQMKKSTPSTFSCIRDIIQSPQRSSVDDAKLTNAKWSRNEDKLIISNCQTYGINQSAFSISADSIGSKTAEEVKERFLHLLKMLSEKIKYEEE